MCPSRFPILHEKTAIWPSHILFFPMNTKQRISALTPPLSLNVQIQVLRLWVLLGILRCSLMWCSSSLVMLKVYDLPLKPPGRPCLYFKTRSEILHSVALESLAHTASICDLQMSTITQVMMHPVMSHTVIKTIPIWSKHKKVSQLPTST